MRFVKHIRLLILLSPLLVVAQTKQTTASQSSASGSPSQVEELKQTPDKIPQRTTVQRPPNAMKSFARSGGGIEILSDTMGVNFLPYLKRVKTIVQPHWLELVPESARPPEMKSGTTVLRFEILRNGAIRGLRIEQSAGDEALDRAAYGAVVYSNPLPSLPADFRGDYLSIRTRFLYNPAKAELGEEQNAKHEDSKEQQKKPSEPYKEKFAPPKQPSQF